MKKPIFSLFLLCSAMAYSQGTIPIPQVTGLPAALAGKVDKLTGKSLVADTLSAKIQPHVTNTANPHSVTKAQVGLGNVDNTSDINKPISSATQTALNGKQPTGTYSTDIHANITALNAVQGVNHGDQTDITGNAGTATKLQTSRTINGVSFDGTQNITINAVDATSQVASSLLGAANGVATLDANGIILTTQLPSYIDDVLEYTNLAAFPATGETGKIYVAKDTNKTYRWAGSVYVYITSGAVDSVNGYTGVVSLSKTDLGLGNLDNTSDANKPISTATQSALNGKQASGTYSTDIHGNISALNAVSGTNSGDETLTSIKTKLGAASSSNSGYLTNIDFSNFDGKQNALGYTPWWSSNHPTTISGYGITDVDVNATDDAIVRRSGSGLAMITGGYLKTTLANINAVSPTEIFTGNGDGVIRRSSLANTMTAFGLNSISTQSTGGLTTNYITKWDGSKLINTLTTENGTTTYFNGSAQFWNPTVMVDRLSILATTASTSPTTGALVVSGGLGVGGASFFNSDITVKNANVIGTGAAGGQLNFGDVNHNIRTIFGQGIEINTFGVANGFKLFQTTGNATVGYATDQGYKLAVNGTGYFGGAITGGDLHINNNYLKSSYGTDIVSYQQSNGTYTIDLNGVKNLLTIDTSAKASFVGKVKVNDVTDATIDPTPDGSIVTAGGIAAAKKIQAGGEIFSKGNIIADGNMYAGGSVQAASFSTYSGTSSQLMVADGSVVDVSSIGGGVNQTQTTVNASISGNMVCSMPFQTGSYKKVMIMLNSMNGDATYTFPVPFTRATHGQFSQTISGLGFTYTNTTSSITITSASNANNTGCIILEGY